MVYALSALGTLSFICNRQHLRGRRRRLKTVLSKVDQVFQLTRSLSPFEFGSLIIDMQRQPCQMFIFVGGLDGFCLEQLCKSKSERDRWVCVSFYPISPAIFHNFLGEMPVRSCQIEYCHTAFQMDSGVYPSDHQHPEYRNWFHCTRPDECLGCKSHLSADAPGNSARIF